jgi:hypothetical protein
LLGLVCRAAGARVGTRGGAERSEHNDRGAAAHEQPPDRAAGRHEAGANLKRTGRRDLAGDRDAQRLAHLTAPPTPHIPIACARSRGSVKTLRMIDIATGLSIEPPTACIARKTISHSSVGAALHSSEPSVKMINPV